MVGQEKDDAEVMLMMEKPKKRVVRRGKEKPTPLSALKKKKNKQKRMENSMYNCCANNPSSWERAGFLDTPQAPGVKAKQ